MEASCGGLCKQRGYARAGATEGPSLSISRAVLPLPGLTLQCSSVGFCAGRKACTAAFAAHSSWAVPFCSVLQEKAVCSFQGSGKNDEKSYPACLPDVGDYTLVPCRARRICEVSMVVLVKTTSQVVRSQEFKELAGAACQVAGHHTLEEYNAMNRAELFDGITA